MAADELTRSLLLEEAASRHAIAEALFASVTGGVPLLQALVDSRAASDAVVSRILSRNAAPFLRQVAPAFDLVHRLPPGLCERLLAVPVRLDAFTGTVDVVVPDASDPHPGDEIAFHLGAPVRLVRAPLAAIEEAIRRLRIAPRQASLAPSRRGLVVEPDSVPPPAPAVVPRVKTPPWGTPVHSMAPPVVVARPGTDPPKSGYGSEIPIPLTRKTLNPVGLSGGTLRPEPVLEPPGQGYAFDPTGLREVIERTAPRFAAPAVPGGLASFLPAPPPPSAGAEPASRGASALGPDLSGVLAALRNAASRDEVLDLVLTGARALAVKVALFVVKKGGYVGWLGSPEVDGRALQSAFIPLDESTVLDRAVRDDLYLGRLSDDAVHAPLVRVLRNPSRDVAVVPVRVSGKTAVVIVADELSDTMLGTRRLEELARAAGEAFVRIVRTRR